MSPVPPVTEIGPRAPALQTAFCDYVPQVFRRVDFRRWCAWGEWNDDYRAFAVLEDGPVLPALRFRALAADALRRHARSIRFGFTPERWWPGAVEAGEDLEADLFVRKLSLSRKPHRFPVLART